MIDTTFTVNVLTVAVALVTVAVYVMQRRYRGRR